jgi:hypothetical protein
MTETAMSDGKGDRDSNGWRQCDRDGGGDGSRQPQQWPTTAATVMGDCNSNSNGNGDDNGNGNGDGDGDGVGVKDGNGYGKGDGHGEGNHEWMVASSCGGNVQRFWMGNTLPPPPLT